MNTEARRGCLKEILLLCELHGQDIVMIAMDEVEALLLGRGEGGLRLPEQKCARHLLKEENILNSALKVLEWSFTFSMWLRNSSKHVH